MVDNTVLKKVNKSQYLGNGLTESHEIWHSDDTIRYIYVRSKADAMVSLIYRTEQKRKIREN